MKNKLLLTTAIASGMMISSAALAEVKVYGDVEATYKSVSYDLAAEKIRDPLANHLWEILLDVQEMVGALPPSQREIRGLKGKKAKREYKGSNNFKDAENFFIS